MPVQIPDVRVGEPLRFEALTVFPLFTDSDSPVEYDLSDEAISSKTLTVEEVGEEGAVPELLVDNKGDRRVLFLEGEELVGAKQNRILNISILVPAKTKMKVPVSCVEQGRWAYKSRHFTPSGSHSPHALRSALKTSVSRAVKISGQHHSDQGAVWHEVEKMQAALRVDSSTAAMADSFGKYEERIADFRENLKYVEGASGMAFAIGSTVVSFDVFDKPSTCKQVWDQLLSGFVLDALRTEDCKETVESGSVKELLNASGDAAWEAVETVGEGQEYRVEFKENQGFVLSFEEVPVHASGGGGEALAHHHSHPHIHMNRNFLEAQGPFSACVEFRWFPSGITEGVESLLDSSRLNFLPTSFCSQASTTKPDWSRSQSNDTTSKPMKTASLETPSTYLTWLTEADRPKGLQPV